MRIRLAAVIAASAGIVVAHADPLPPQQMPGDFGGGGILQIPTAEMGEDGDVAAFFSVAQPYRRFGADVTALPWAALALRFTQISGVPYGPVGFGAGQSYLDRGVDARVRLFHQDGVLPDVTLGLRDIVGNGLFDAEYIVATGAFDDVDLTLGLGWGALASDHMFRNPLAFIAGATKPTDISAGSLRGDYFAGPSMALFGGLRAATPIRGLEFEFEFDSDDTRDDPFRALTRIRSDSPIDVGFVYRPTSWLALSAGYERGNTAMLKLALLGNVAQAAPIRGPDTVTSDTVAGTGGPSETMWDLMATQGWRLLSTHDDGNIRHAELAWIGPNDKPPSSETIGRAARLIAHVGMPVDRLEVDIIVGTARHTIELSTRSLELAVAETGRTREIVEAALVHAPPIQVNAPEVRQADAEIERRLAIDLDRVDFTLLDSEIRGAQLVVRFSQDIYRDETRALGVASRAILADLPPQIALVTFVFSEEGVDTGQVSMLRHELAAVMAREASADELLHNADFTPASPPGPGATANPDAYPRWSYALRPGLKTDTAGPNGLVLYDLDARAGAEAALAPGISVSAAVAASLASDFSRLTLPSDSVLPHVRSDIADYLRDGKYGIARLETDLIQEPAPDLYVRETAGLLEDMFGGVDAEALYRPDGENWAVGVDVNHVWQRGFHERFQFRPYQVTTAVAEGYLALGWYDLTASVKAGRYLAGDVGGTVELYRTFTSGVRIGAFATATDVSGRQFGEGRFDKGLFVSVPLDWLLGYASQDRLDYTYRPVIRDGGQLIDTAKPLYDVTDGTQPDRLLENWHDIAP